MPLRLTSEERSAVEAAQARSAKVRHWRRYRAVLLRAAEVPVAEVPVAEGARDLGGTEASVYNWTAAWRREGLAGVAAGAHLGAVRRLPLDAEGGGGT